tara:strand:- start:101 stop:646 length:546 start_codon:yes stop_codon:yes gene_type:complete
MNIGGIPQWIVKKVNKPAFSISEGVHKYLNHTFYYPGRVEYEKTTITLVDPIAPDASAIMMEILTNSGYRIPDNQDDTITISKKKAVEALGNVVISQLGAEGDIADQFTFINPWMSSVKFGDLDYEGDNLIDLTLELRYDFVQMTKVGSKGFAKYAGNGKKAGVTTAGGGKGAAGGKPIDI